MDTTQKKPLKIEHTDPSFYKDTKQFYRLMQVEKLDEKTRDKRIRCFYKFIKLQSISRGRPLTKSFTECVPEDLVQRAKFFLFMARAANTKLDEIENPDHFEFTPRSIEAIIHRICLQSVKNDNVRAKKGKKPKPTPTTNKRKQRDEDSDVEAVEQALALSDEDDSLDQPEAAPAKPPAAKKVKRAAVKKTKAPPAPNKGPEVEAQEPRPDNPVAPVGLTKNPKDSFEKAPPFTTKATTAPAVPTPTKDVDPPAATKEVDPPAPKEVDPPAATKDVDPPAATKDAGPPKEQQLQVTAPSQEDAPTPVIGKETTAPAPKEPSASPPPVAKKPNFRRPIKKALPKDDIMSVSIYGTKTTLNIPKDINWENFNRVLNSKLAFGEDDLLEWRPQFSLDATELKWTTITCEEDWDAIVKDHIFTGVAFRVAPDTQWHSENEDALDTTSREDMV